MFKKIFLVLFLTVTTFAQAEDSLVMDYINLKPNENVLVNLEFPDRCMQGDYDIIQEEIFFSYRNGGAGLFMTAENLDAKAGRPLTLISNAVPFRSLAKYLRNFKTESKQYALELPKGDNQAIILSICKGTSEVSNCDDALVWSYDNLNIAYHYNVHMVDGEPKDKTYYKQMLHKKGDKLFFTKSIIGEVNFPLLQKYANENFSADMKNPAKKKVLQKHLNDIGTLRSLPIRQSENDSLIIRLPHYNKKRCIL